MILQAFREREGEPGAVTAREPLRNLLSFHTPRDAVGAAIRQAQLDALVRLAPATVGAQLMAAGLVAWSLRGMIADLWLGLWFGAVLIACIVRGSRAVRLRLDPGYARRRPPELVSIVAVMAVLAALWLVPPVFWFAAVDVEHKLMMGVLVIALMSAGSVSLASVPQAVLVYISILSIGGLVMTSQFEQPVHMALMLIFATALSFGAIANARRFIGHVRAQIELREQSELITLLREFEASGSDWLWEVDADLKLSYMSQAMADAIGKPLAELMGKHARHILDPDGNAVQLSAGMRALMDHAERRAAFRDVAVPIDHGRCWPSAI